jgi:hypothetical protein
MQSIRNAWPDVRKKPIIPSGRILAPRVDLRTGGKRVAPVPRWEQLQRVRAKPTRGEDSVDSGPNPAERNEASLKQQPEKNAHEAKDQRRQEAEERLERRQIRHEEREDRKRGRQKARGQEESSP